MFPLIILAILGVVGLLVQRLLTHRRHRKLAREAGCKPIYRRQHRWPLALDFLREVQAADKDNNLPKYFSDVHKQLGQRNTWITNVLGQDVILTIEPENIKAILATQFKDFELGPERKGVFSPLFANGIFSDDGARWEHSRALIRPQFARDQLTDLVALERHVQNLMRALPVNEDHQTSSIDLSPLFFRLTLDSATEFLFGQSVDSQIAALTSNPQSTTTKQSKDELEWHRFGPAWDSALWEIGQRLRLGGLYWLHNNKILRNSCAEVHRFGDHFVQQALSRAQSTTTSDEGPTTTKQYVFLDELLKSTTSPVELRDQLLNVLLAGRDTTAGLLGFVFYHLSLHPEIYTSLRTTILSQFGTYSQPTTDTTTINFTTLKSCQPLQHILSETLRLHPSVPFNSRRSTRDTTLPLGGGPDGLSPVFVPKNTEVNYMVHVMQRAHNIWGADADEFKPERWVGRKTGWEFLPFNGGPRICLGQQYALTTAGYVVVRMVQRFESIGGLVRHSEKDEGERFFFTATAGPVHVKVRLREGGGGGGEGEGEARAHAL